MYLNKIEIKNIKSIAHATMTFQEGEQAGWHVLIGGNGMGKSAFIKAVALTLIGPNEVAALNQNWNEWLTAGTTEGSASIIVQRDGYYDHPSRQGNTKDRTINSVSLTRSTNDGDNLASAVIASFAPKKTHRYIWGEKNHSHWFSSAFGPFRRFTGGDPRYARLYAANPRTARHISAFEEDVALTEAKDWLIGLHNDELQAIKNGECLGHGRVTTELIINFINQSDLLPDQVELREITSRDVFFEDKYGKPVELYSLSDGFRSILSLTLELIRQLNEAYQGEGMFWEEGGKVVMDTPGVVLIDEIDAHLHPTWQAKIGEWFSTYFPKMQFIVTTHSPFVCRDASYKSVWQFVPHDNLQGNQLVKLSEGEIKQLLYGNILDAYLLPAFGGGDLIEEERVSTEKQRLSQLEFLWQMNRITKEEEEERQQLLQKYGYHVENRS